MGQKPIEGSNPSLSAICCLILVGLDQVAVTATKRGFEPEIWKRGFDKIAEGDFGRRARVARRARAEGPSQSLPLRHTANQFSTFSIRLPWQPRSGDNARQGGPGSNASPERRTYT